MRASEIKKESITIENIYENMKGLPSDMFKHFIPHFIYVSESVKSQLMKDGYKIYYGDWDGQMKDCLIIEW